MNSDSQCIGLEFGQVIGLHCILELSFHSLCQYCLAYDTNEGLELLASGHQRHRHAPLVLPAGLGRAALPRGPLECGRGPLHLEAYRVAVT